MGPGVRRDDEDLDSRYFFCAAARSTKVLPPFILWASGASLIWITTASASTPRFFTSACVVSRIMPAFCSSVRPAGMLTVISGILVPPFSFVTSLAANTILILRSAPLVRVSKDAPIVLMVRDGARAPPHHEA